MAKLGTKDDGADTLDAVLDALVDSDPGPVGHPEGRPRRVMWWGEATLDFSFAATAFGTVEAGEACFPDAFENARKQWQAGDAADVSS